MNYITLLFNNSFNGNFLLVPKNEYVYYVMSYLGTYNKFMILFIVILAAFFAHLTNYILGFIFRKLEIFSFMKDRTESLYRGEKIFATKFWWLLLLVFLPSFGCLISAGAGVLRYNYIKFIYLILASNIIAYAYLIFFSVN